jgi:hypothetical protein
LSPGQRLQEEARDEPALSGAEAFFELLLDLPFQLAGIDTVTFPPFRAMLDQG